MTTRLEVIEELIDFLQGSLENLESEYNDEATPFLNELNDESSESYEYAKDKFDDLQNEYFKVKDFLESVLDYVAE